MKKVNQFEIDPSKIKKGDPVKVNPKLALKPLPKNYIKGCVKEISESIISKYKLDGNASTDIITIKCENDNDAEKILSEINIVSHKNLNNYIDKQNDDCKKYYKTVVSFISTINNGLITITFS